MERIAGINPDRFLWCCADLGVSVDECASATDIALVNFEKLLAGEPSLTFNQLKKIADYFGRGVLFFLEQTPVSDAAVHSPQFRTLANQKPELSARISARATTRWETSRVMGTALLVGITATPWPDLAVAATMSGLFLSSAWQILTRARAELRQAATTSHDHPHDHDPDHGHVH